MKSRALSGITAITLFAALAVPIQLAAQHSRYKLIDIGTVGGPNSIGLTGNPNAPQSLNNRGMVAVCQPELSKLQPTVIPSVPGPIDCAHSQMAKRRARRSWVPSGQYQQLS